VDSTGGGGAGNRVRISKNESVGSPKTCIYIFSMKDEERVDIQFPRIEMHRQLIPFLFPPPYWDHRDVNARNETNSSVSHLPPAQNVF
jgi:hypothetical protein